MLTMAFTQGEMPLQGQDRLFFQLRLEGATHPVALWTYRLNERWGLRYRDMRISRSSLNCM